MLALKLGATACYQTSVQKVRPQRRRANAPTRGILFLTTRSLDDVNAILSMPGVQETRLISLLAGKIQGILPILPLGRSQRVQNTETITISHERIPGALEQGNFGSHQGIELGIRLLSRKELSLALVDICAKRK
jgi:hypothetical protein